MVKGTDSSEETVVKLSEIRYDTYGENARHFLRKHPAASPEGPFRIVQKYAGRRK